jgi:hypothetical protein
MEKAENGNYVCPHNPSCECEAPKCHKCGWNPEVTDRRLKKCMKDLGIGEKKYQVPFTGYCEVWADSPEEAAEKAEDINLQFFAQYIYGNPVCLSKEE